MAAIINEGSTAYLTVTFRDKSGELAVPDAVTWQAHDVKSGQELMPETAISPATSIEITIPPYVNQIVNEKNSEETRRVTVKATYGQDDQANAQYDYIIKNLSKI